MAEQLDSRFRSFSERYIIERAGKFEIGREQEQAWLALQDAKKIYGMIAEAANPVVVPDGGMQCSTQASATPVKSAPPPTVPNMFSPLPPTK